MAASKEVVAAREVAAKEEEARLEAEAAVEEANSLIKTTITTLTCPDGDHVTSGPDKKAVTAAAARHATQTGHAAAK